MHRNHFFQNIYFGIERWSAKKDGNFVIIRTLLYFDEEKTIL